jgi:raffinose/stachyose/melibiose transport system substrate-binding protein
LRSLAVIAAAGALVSTLAACSTTGGSTSSGTGKGQVTFVSWDSLDTMKPLVTEFQKENPGITIKISYVPPVQQYIDTLQKQLLAGNAPDVFILGNRTEQAGGGYVKDLTGTAAAKAVSPFNAKMESYKGKVYGISVADWGGGFFVNEALTEKAGITEAPTSWDDLLADFGKLKDDGTVPYLEAGDGISTTMMGLLGLAAHNAKTDFETDIYDGKSTFSATYTKPVQTWSELYSQGLVSKDAAALTGQQVADEFNSGRVAMIPTGPWAISAARAALGQDAKLTFWAIPGTTAGQTFWAGAASPAYAINSKAKNPVGAQKWVDFLASAKGTEIYHTTTAAITTTNNYKPTLDPALKDVYTAIVAGDIYCTWQTWPGANSSALDAQFLGDVQKIMLGQSTAKDLTADLDTKLASLK